MIKLFPYWVIGVFLLSCGRPNSSLTDLDGHTYPTKVFGDTEWMLENLRVSVDSTNQPVNFFHPDSLEANEKEYGLLYDFETACKVCPIGWELPSLQDWGALLREIGDSSAIKMKDPAYWEGEVNSNDSQFAIRPAGYGNSGEFDNLFGQRSIFWTSNHEGEDYWTFVLEAGVDTVRKAPQHPIYAFSVRCIRR